MKITERSRVRAVLFDADNTLLDYIGYKDRAAKAVSLLFSREMPGWHTRGQFYDLIFAIYATHTTEYEGAYTEMLEMFKMSENERSRLRQKAIILHNEIRSKALKPYPEVLATLSTLRSEFNLVLGVVSDAPREKLWQRLVVSGLDNEFDIVVSQDDTGVLKPDPKPFGFALGLLGLETTPGSVLFVGDNPERDIVGAKGAGMLACLARYGQWNMAETGVEPDFVIDQFSGLIDVIRNLS
ncbi:MAG: HAD family hydrolase [Candidatus Bilamarchaeaceae archaeon]